MTDRAINRGPPTEVRRGKLGRGHKRGNSLSDVEMEAMYPDRLGVSRADCNRELPRSRSRSLGSVLEVRCNVGMHLRHFCGTTPLRHGSLALQQGTLHQAGATLSVAQRPAPDQARSIDEMHRVPRRWICGSAYWASASTKVPIRGTAGLLWKRDFRAAWQDRFQSLRVVRERRLTHPADPTLCDAMHLLEKA